MQYDAALVEAKKALSVDTYDEAANYYYGVINNKIGNLVDAKDGFDIASMGVEYRSAAWLALANIYLREQNIPKATEYARKATNFNGYSIEGYQLLAIIYRIQKNRARAQTVLDTLLLYDPLNHFARFEKYLWQPTAANKQQFSGLVRNEMPRETYLELATWYYQTGRNEEALKLLQIAPPNAEVSYWIAFLGNKKLDPPKLSPDMVFPFRAETADVLKNPVENQ
jgi:tetratricopeptide (TPR) repeat protein